MEPSCPASKEPADQGNGAACARCSGLHSQPELAQGGDDPLRTLQVFGLGLAASILIDATLVRLVLVPSVMELLREANCWLPSWLDRILPHLGTEADIEETRPALPPIGPVEIRVKAGAR